MNPTIILVRKHGSQKWELLQGPEVPLPAKNAAYQELARGSAAPHKEIAEVKFVQLSDMRKPLRLLSADEAKARKAQADKTDAAIAKQVSDAAKMDKKRESDLDAKEKAQRLEQLKKINAQHASIRTNFGH